MSVKYFSNISINSYKEILKNLIDEAKLQTILTKDMTGRNSFGLIFILRIS